MDLVSFGLWAMTLFVLGAIAAQLRSIVGQLAELNRQLKTLSWPDRGTGR